MADAPATLEGRTREGEGVDMSTQHDTRRTQWALAIVAALVFVAAVAAVVYLLGTLPAAEFERIGVMSGITAP